MSRLQALFFPTLRRKLFLRTSSFQLYGWFYLWFKTALLHHYVIGISNMLVQSQVNKSGTGHFGGHKHSLKNNFFKFYNNVKNEKLWRTKRFHLSFPQNRVIHLIMLYWMCFSGEGESVLCRARGGRHINYHPPHSFQ